MSVRVCSHQPSFFPWAGFWHKVASSDVVIFSCGVKMDYGGFQNRVQLDGSWWTLPVPKAAKHLPLMDVRFDRALLPKVLHQARHALCGKRWPHRDTVEAILQDTVARLGDSNFLLDLNHAAFEAVADALGLYGQTVILDFGQPDSDLGKTENLLARIRRHVGPDSVYLAGPGARAYLDHDIWPETMGLKFQECTKPVDSGTVLQLISREGDALGVLSDAFTWRDARAAGKNVFGDSAALG